MPDRLYMRIPMDGEGREFDIWLQGNSTKLTKAEEKFMLTEVIHYLEYKKQQIQRYDEFRAALCIGEGLAVFAAEAKLKELE